MSDPQDQASADESLSPQTDAVVPEFTAADLVVRIPAVTLDATNGDVLAMFADHPEWPCLAVVDSTERVLGMMDRTTLTMTFARPILRDLYNRRSVIRLMHRDCLVVETTAGIDDIGSILEHEKPEALLSGFVVTENGRYAGVATGLALMARALDQARVRSAALEEARNAAEAASEAKGMFLANMSHEIRTPLNGVLANLELLKLSHPDREQLELVDAADLAAQTLLGLIGDVLDFSKIEANRMDLELIATSPRNLAGAAIALLQGQALKKDLQLCLFVDPAVPRSVRADPHRVRQVLLNLCGNAIKFTESGGIYVCVDWVSGDDASCWLRFSVHDTGIGIEPSQAATLIEAFTQADGSTTRRFGGTGLGLAISKRLIERMGGTIQCVGEPGTGSSFWFDVPVEVEDPTPQPAVSVASLRVLMTAEAPADLDALDQQMAGRGAFVSVAAPLAYGLSALRDGGSNRRLYDAVVTRLASGQDVPALYQPGTHGVPSVLLADLPDLASRRRAHAKGYEVILPRDAPMPALLQAIATVAGRVRTRPSIRAEATDLEARAARLRERAKDRVVLVLEDNPMNQTVVRKQLDKLGVPHEIVANGVEGLARVGRKTYAAVLADGHMPDMDGYAFTRRLRDQETGTDRHLPVIAMTANAVAGEEDRCRVAGMDDYLAKPVTLNALAEKLETWIAADQTAPTPACGPSISVFRPDRAAAKDSQAGADAPIDVDRLREILGGMDTDTIWDVLTCFSETLDDLARDMRKAAEDQDRRRLRESAHAAKGAALNAAAQEFGALCGAIEARANDGDWIELNTLVGSTEHLTGRLRQAIADLVPPPKAAPRYAV